MVEALLAAFEARLCQLETRLDALASSVEESLDRRCSASFSGKPPVSPPAEDWAASALQFTPSRRPSGHRMMSEDGDTVCGERDSRLRLDSGQITAHMEELINRCQEESARGDSGHDDAAVFARLLDSTGSTGLEDFVANTVRSQLRALGLLGPTGSEDAAQEPAELPVPHRPAEVLGNDCAASTVAPPEACTGSSSRPLPLDPPSAEAVPALLATPVGRRSNSADTEFQLQAGAQTVASDEGSPATRGESPLEERLRHRLSTLRAQLDKACAVSTGISLPPARSRRS
eukprot:TRINITY_DN12115_c0_g1_i1.p2 TRINITY_DN12115_c0_g1~~TRINITY_DN12115_c0_g1_i1.p2  ORF type:complete len:288 (+),score=58.70 TRINITY_DN12115_c0_g1_i1:106-969(+)